MLAGDLRRELAFRAAKGDTQRGVTEEGGKGLTAPAAGEGVRDLARRGNEEEKGSLAAGPGAR